MRPLYACLDGSKEKDKTITSFDEDVEKLKLSYMAGGNVKWCSHFAKFYQFIKKLDIELPYDPTVLFLGMYPRKLKANIHMSTTICFSILPSMDI